MSAGLLALFLFILLALGFADKNWLNTPDKIWSRSPGSNTFGNRPVGNVQPLCQILLRHSLFFPKQFDKSPRFPIVHSNPSGFLFSLQL